MLAGTPSSNRCVEIEVVNRIVKDTAFSNTCTPILDLSNLPNSLNEFISPIEEDSFPPYPQTIRLLSLLSSTNDRDRFEVQQDLDRGYVENWPVKFKHPQDLNIRCNSHLLSELQQFFQDLYGSSLECILPRIDKFGRCEVNGMKFSSNFNSTDRASIVKVMFVDNAGELAPYFGTVRFFFKTKIVVNGESLKHELAYVTWMKFRYSGPDPISHLYGVTNDTYQRDRIISPRRLLSRCVLVSPNPAASLHLVSELIK